MPKNENPKEDLERLESLRAQLHAVSGRPLEFPEAGFRLDLKSRAGDETRQFKHLHQMRLMHSVAFRRANEIKLLYLVDAFSSLAASQNPLGMYAAARSLLELRATLVDSGQRLRLTGGIVGRATLESSYVLGTPAVIRRRQKSCEIRVYRRIIRSRST